jgi:hypothetical protein
MLPAGVSASPHLPVSFTWRFNFPPILRARGRGRGGARLTCPFALALALALARIARISLARMRVVCICTITMAVSDQPYIYEVNRHSNERQPLFYFISFTNPCSPLTAIVIVYIFYPPQVNTGGVALHACHKALRLRLY